MEINEYLIKLIQTIKSMEDLELFKVGSMLSKTEFRLLREIIIEGEEGKKIISSELARRLGITRSAVSQIVTKMEEKDILQRVDSPTDRKIAYIQLSDRALEIFSEQCQQANIFMNKVVAELGEEKMNNLITAYDEFTQVLNRVHKQAVEIYREEGTLEKHAD